MAELFDYLTDRTRFTHHFVQHLIVFCSRPEATSDVISGGFVGPVVPDNCMKFGDPRLNLSLEIPPQAAFSTVFFNFDNCQKEVVSDVTSGMAD